MWFHANRLRLRYIHTISPTTVGQMDAHDYAKKAYQWAKALRLLDPSIKLISCGGTCDHFLRNDPYLSPTSYLLPCHAIHIQLADTMFRLMKFSETGAVEWDHIILQKLAPVVDFHSIHSEYRSTSRSCLTVKMSSKSYTAFFVAITDSIGTAYTLSEGKHEVNVMGREYSCVRESYLFSSLRHTPPSSFLLHEEPILPHITVEPLVCIVLMFTYSRRRRESHRHHKIPYWPGQN